VILADTFEWSTFPDAIRFIGDNPGLLWDKSLQQLGLSVAALAIAVVIALPLGVILGHLHKGSFIAITVANLGRALPSLVLIAFGLLIFGIGFWNNAAALIVLAVPPILTNAYFAVDEIDPSIVEAARGMGMRPRRHHRQPGHLPARRRRRRKPVRLPPRVRGGRLSRNCAEASDTFLRFAGLTE